MKAEQALTKLLITFKLIICKSEGTSYENFIHNMVEIEVEETYQFIDALRSQGKDVPNIEKAVCHMIVSGMFSGIFELIEHDMKKENAKKYVSEFQDFYIAGWSKILGLSLIYLWCSVQSAVRLLFFRFIIYGR